MYFCSLSSFSFLISPIHPPLSFVCSLVRIVHHIFLLLTFALVVSFPMRLPRIIMGCGHSTFNLMEEGMACGGLKRRMVESRSKNNLIINDNHDPSTKLLLNDGGGDPAVGSNHGRNASSESVVMKERVEGEKGERGVNKCDRGTETNDDEGERGEDNDFGRRISDFDGGLVGSPSFREYCVDSESDDQDAVNYGRGNGEGREKKTQGSDNNVVVSGEFCVLPGAKLLEKKESRGRKFTRVFPTMHRPKNLWHKTISHRRNNHRHVPSDKLHDNKVI